MYVTVGNIGKTYFAGRDVYGSMSTMKEFRPRFLK
jgi:hypothetical protein